MKSNSSTFKLPALHSFLSQIGISKDGDFDLPEGLILNPKVREHWLLIEKTLGMDYEEDDSEEESAGDGPENNLVNVARKYIFDYCSSP